MGREIRRVPKGWEHPRNARTGHYEPMFDRSFAEAAQEWWDKAVAWHNGEVEESETEYREKYPWYWQWTDNPPDAESHRPDFGDTATHYQMYEDVSEGTPVSPVFETLGELAEWLVSQGYSEDAAAKFCELGWVPSMVMCRQPDGTADIRMGVAALEPDFCPEGKSE